MRWHDGEPFTSADVKFTFDSLLLRFHARTRASLGAAIASIETTDDSTVVFRLREPYAVLLQQLDVVEAPILPRHLFSHSDPMTNRATQRPIGTGPFRFVSHTQDAEVRFEANDEYFMGRPAISQVVMRVISDAGAQVVALEAGEVDWLYGVPGADRARLAADSQVRLIETTVNPGGSNCVNTLAFNLDRPALKDVRVRRAVAHAIDRQTLVERVEFGGGRAGVTPISSRIAVARNAELVCPAHDTLAAGRQLTAAGWVRGADRIRVARGLQGIADGTRLATSLEVSCRGPRRAVVAVD